MTAAIFKEIFTEQVLSEIFPAGRTDDFFDALYGDSEEGAYEIKLVFQEFAEDSKTLHFRMDLRERPGKCLACNLTYGLPEVFSRHPVIDIQGTVDRISELISGHASCRDWQLGATQPVSGKLYSIPLKISLG